MLHGTFNYSGVLGVQLTTFAIEESVASGEHRVSIPADLATCDDCLRELFDRVAGAYARRGDAREGVIEIKHPRKTGIRP